MKKIAYVISGFLAVGLFTLAPVPAAAMHPQIEGEVNVSSSHRFDDAVSSETNAGASIGIAIDEAKPMPLPSYDGEPAPIQENPEPCDPEICAVTTMNAGAEAETSLVSEAWNGFVSLFVANDAHASADANVEANASVSAGTGFFSGIVNFFLNIF